jgi:C-terminal processing protease CtpA/Prc
VTTSEEATKHILGERGSSITLQLERDGERFVVAMRRGTAATLKK